MRFKLVYSEICNITKIIFSVLQSYELKFDNTIDLCLIQEYKLNNVVTSCDITSDGYILAMGLDCGNVVVSKFSAILN